MVEPTIFGGIMKSKTCFRWSSVVAICLLLVTAAPAQEFGEVAEEFRRNIDALHGYAWQSKVEITVDGKLTRTEIYQIRVDADGKVNRELTGADGKTTKEQGIAERTLGSLRSLINGYTHMKPDDFREVFGENPRTVSPGEGDEPTRILASDVVASGDTMQIWVDNTTYRVQKLELETQLQGEPARLVVDFERIGTGPSYPVRSTLWTKHKKKSMTIVTENTDPTQSGQ
jgi:hypothetical protein